MAVGLPAIPIVLLGCFTSVGISVTVLRLSRSLFSRVVRILTWGGLRGGISVALALSLPAGPERGVILPATCIVVAISIVVQGLTIGRFARARGGPEAEVVGQ